MIKNLNKDTKKAQGFIWAYHQAIIKKCRTIYDAYRMPSDVKVKTYNDIVERCYEMGGTNLHVISHGCQFYSTAYQVASDLIVDTPFQTYRIRNVYI